ncbi:uncharacterized protein N7503_003055 [Penicillium pulvis]|uniref:uncharacterized protein n=1 Tax=Penicillium pulvis TaxID=1562058 RepID=UPI0025466437|nr:uncharacterized protein N7503_003055 [Penicillium pulvis]KAJ5805453.1 hypothetical protein N7503_003055 [Penicillium pulvis]
MDQVDMEVAPSPQFEPTMDDAKKKKKSRKSKNKDRSSPAPISNGLASSPGRSDDSSQEKKRKRDSEVGHKKQKKHKLDSTQNGMQNSDSSVNSTVDSQAQSSEPDMPVKTQKSATNGLETPPSSCCACGQWHRNHHKHRETEEAPWV